MYLINQIKNDLAKRVKFGETLVYASFLELYELYKEWVPEGVFATEVMNIDPANFHSLKSGSTCTIVPFFEFDAPTIEMIRLEMEQKFQNSELDYETFSGIYKDYQHLVKEQDFAKIIFDINNSFFYVFKKGLYRARIFKNEENLFIIHYAKLYDLLFSLYKEKKIGKNKKINYQAFLQLHQQYAPYLSETDFAVCLGLNFGTYRSIKMRKKSDGSGSETILFRNPKIDYSKIDIERLQQIYRNKKINYYQFKEIYLQYGNGLKEDEFARILGIPFNTFANFREKKVLNLMILKRALTEKEKAEILLECRRKGLTRRYITYQEFLGYYEPYKDYVSVTDFAYIIGIKQHSVHCLKGGSNALALNFDFNSQISNMIQHELMMYHCRSVSYQEFLELFSKYSNYVTETEFSYILGFSLSEYYKIKKHEEAVAPIDFYKVKRNIIKHWLKESKMYTWNDFEFLAKMVELDIEKILILYFGEDKMAISQRYFQALQTNGQLYLGKTPLQDTTLVDVIADFCKNYAKAVCINLGCTHLVDDIAAEAVAYVLENCGSFEINFGHEWWDFYRPYLVGIMKNWCRIQIFKTSISLDAPIGNSKKKRTRYDFIASTEDGYSEIDEIFNENNGGIYNQIISAINSGLDIEEAILILAKRLGFQPKEVLDMAKKQMIDQNLVQENQDGTFQLARKNESDS